MDESCSCLTDIHLECFYGDSVKCFMLRMKEEIFGFNLQILRLQTLKPPFMLKTIGEKSFSFMLTLISFSFLPFFLHIDYVRAHLLVYLSDLQCIVDGIELFFHSELKVHFEFLQKVVLLQLSVQLAKLINGFYSLFYFFTTLKSLKVSFGC